MGVRVSMLPASWGDCVWVEHRTRRGVRRVVVDGGTTAAGARLRARLAALPADERHVDLLIVTHVDADHIGGALDLLRRPPAGLTVGEVWFNGRRHLPAGRGAVQGEQLTDVLDADVARYPWNTSVGGDAVATAGPGQLRTVDLAWGARATLLSPTPGALAALVPQWDEAVARARAGRSSDDEEQPVPRSPARTLEELAARPSAHDRTAPNGSSIAVVLELGGRSILLAGDAHPTVLVPALRALAAARGTPRVAVHAVKLPHHGSRANVTDDLVAALRSRRWLVSTNGDRFGHPDPDAVARVIVGARRPVLCFNYRSPHTRRWDDEALRARHGYEVRYPTRRGAGLVVDL